MLSVPLSAPEPADERRLARGCPIDHAHLSRYTLGNLDLELEVLRLFADQAPLTLAELAAASTDKAWRDAAHTLKGSARAVGAVRVAERSEKAERLPVGTTDELRQSAIEAIREALAEAVAHIEHLERSGTAEATQLELDISSR